MHKPLFLLPPLCLLLGSQPAGADEASVRKAFVAKFPKAQVHSVTKLPYLGLYEIVVEGEVLYADEKFDYLIDGNIISTKTMTNLTEQRKRKLSAIPFDELPLESRIQEGQGQRRAQAGGVLRPRLSILQARGERPRQARQRHDLHVPVPDRVPAPAMQPTWPSASGARRTRLKAWDDYLLRGVAPSADGSCQNPVDKIVEFGTQEGDQRHADPGVRERRSRTRCHFCGADRELSQQEGELGAARAQGRGRDAATRARAWRSRSSHRPCCTVR